MLCRNLVFTYYDDALQKELLERLVRRLVPGGFLVVGIHESLPGGTDLLSAHDARLGIHVREGR